MKLKFFIVSVALSLFNLNAADAATSSSAADVPPALVFNPEELAKPTGMSSTQWIDALEHDRNTADCIGNFAAFKALTKEISATIGGKYGISTPTTVEEQLDLIYSITRTRHKFCGKRNMLSDFYGINSTYENMAHAAFILAVDTMATKAMDDEDFENLWAAFNSDSTAAAGFIAMVREHASANEQALLTAALQEPLTSFFLTNHATVSLANEVFNIFAPKITLRKIYTEMIGGEYRGWTVHGADAFAYPISLHPDDIVANPGLEDHFRTLFKGQLASGKDVEILACASIGHYLPTAEDSQTIILEYVYDDLIGVYSYDLREVKPKSLLLRRATNPVLAGLLAKFPAQSLKLQKLSIYKNLIAFKRKLLTGTAMPCDELIQLLSFGNASAIAEYADYLYDGTNGIPKNVAVALTKYREAADLGNKSARKNLPNFLFKYAIDCFYGFDGTKENIEKSVELYEEADRLGLSINSIVSLDSVQMERIICFFRDAGNAGCEIAAQNFPGLLNNSAVHLFSSKKATATDIIKSIELLKEATDLGFELSKTNLAEVRKMQAVWLFNGEKGFVKNMPKAIEICREAILLGSEQAVENLPTFLFRYATNLLAERNLLLKRDVRKAIVAFREAAALGHKGAINNLPIFLYGYANNLFYGENYIFRDIPLAVAVCREAAALGDEEAIKGLPVFLKDYAFALYKGDNITKDIPRAVEICRESVTLGNQEAKKLFSTFLNNYAVLLFQGQNGVSQNVSKAIEICREASAQGSENATRSLPIFLKDYALWLCKGENGISKDIPKAVDVCRESVTLGNQEAKGFFPTLLNNYAAWLFRGENGIEQNLEMAVKVCREAASLGHEKTRQKLPVYLNTYASALFEGRDNVLQDIPHAIEVCREAAELGNEEAQRNLPGMIAALH
jgi:TPR repeat protein